MTSPPASPHFDEYRSLFHARLPKISSGEPADAAQDKTPHIDIESLSEAPAAPPVTVAPTWGDPASKYLWLVGVEDVRTALEYGSLGQSCGRGRLAHTNLFGAVPAYCGGEIWFRDDSHVWLNGGSGRYPAQTPEELEACAEGFRQAGYKICCFGWDTDRNLPARVLPEGAEEWT